MANVSSGITMGSLYVGCSLALTAITLGEKFVLNKEAVELGKTIKTIAGSFIAMAGMFGATLLHQVQLVGKAGEKLGAQEAIRFLIAAFSVTGVALVAGFALLD
jgi:hypothetical protein